jgi:cell division inhibitor SepF
MFERLLVRLGILEEVEDIAVEDDVLQERKRRVLEPLPSETTLVLCRGSACIERREALGEALRQGRLVLMDLRTCERGVGQNILDFVCSVAYAEKGDVRRIAPGVFLALSDVTVLEEWDMARTEKKDERAESDEERSQVQVGPGGEEEP